MDARFQVIWEERLRPVLETLDEKRVRLLQRRTVLGCAGLVAGSLAGIVLHWLADKGSLWSAWLVCSLIGTGGGLYWGQLAIRDFRASIKRLVNSAIFEGFGLGYEPKFVHPVRFQVFHDLGLVPGNYTKKRFEDHFHGRHGGLEFDVYEAELTAHSGKHEVIRFRGILMRIDFPKPVEGVTVVTRDQGWLNGIEALVRDRGDRALKRVGLVDRQFEAAFQAYASDQVMARYVLTPDVMEGLLDIEAAFQGRKMRAAFRPGENSPGELLVALTANDAFEIGAMSQSLLNQDPYKRTIEEIGVVLDMVDRFVTLAGTQAQTERARQDAGE